MNIKLTQTSATKRRNGEDEANSLQPETRQYNKKKERERGSNPTRNKREAIPNRKKRKEANWNEAEIREDEWTNKDRANSKTGWYKWQGKSFDFISYLDPSEENRKL